MKKYKDDKAIFERTAEFMPNQDQREFNTDLNGFRLSFSESQIQGIEANNESFKDKNFTED